MTMIFFFNDTATTEIYTLSLHDALPISLSESVLHVIHIPLGANVQNAMHLQWIHILQNTHLTTSMLDIGLQIVIDRKSTRLNSSHANISYAVFCLKQKQISIPSQPGMLA